MTFLSEAIEAGLTVDQVRQRVRSGAWIRLARGTYLPQGDGALQDLDGFGRTRVEHMLRAVAAASRNRGTVVCDASAAVIHGVRVLTLPPRVQLGVPPGRWSGTRSGVDFRTRDFAADDVMAGRVPLSSPLRCWVDITRFGTLAQSLAAGDSAVRQALINPRAAIEVTERWSGQRGFRRLAVAAPLLDGARESPLESESYAYFVEHRLPLPTCQEVILAGDGRFLGRVDFWWEEARLVGEADGRLKYSDGDAVYAEKRREDDIRAEGFGFIRWGRADLRSPVLADRLRQLLH